MKANVRRDITEVFLHTNRNQYTNYCAIADRFGRLGAQKRKIIILCPSFRTRHIQMVYMVYTVIVFTSARNTSLGTNGAAHFVRPSVRRGSDALRFSEKYYYNHSTKCHAKTPSFSHARTILCCRL